MTQPQTVEDKIKEFILKHFPLARKNGFHPDEKWLESGLVDSLGILDLVNFLETEFSIKVSDEDLLPENFQSLDAVAEFVRRKS
jgi:acyl carrier protein